MGIIPRPIANLHCISGFLITCVANTSVLAHRIRPTPCIANTVANWDWMGWSKRDATRWPSQTCWIEPSSRTRGHVYNHYYHHHHHILYIQTNTSCQLTFFPLRSGSDTSAVIVAAMGYSPPTPKPKINLANINCFHILKCVLGCQPYKEIERGTTQMVRDAHSHAQPHIETECVCIVLPSFRQRQKCYKWDTLPSSQSLLTHLY